MNVIHASTAPVSDLGDVRYKIDHQKRTLFVARLDRLSKDRIFSEWEAMQQVEGFDPTYDTIVDYSGVSSVDLDSSDLLEINREMPARDPRTGNVAIISGLEQGRYLLARFFCKLSNIGAARKHQVFHNAAEAELWLVNLHARD